MSSLPYVSENTNCTSFSSLLWADSQLSSTLLNSLHWKPGQENPKIPYRKLMKTQNHHIQVCNKPMNSPKRILSSQFYKEMWAPVDKRMSLKLLQTFVTNYCSEIFTLSFTSLYFRILGFRSMLWLSLAKTEMTLCKFQVLCGSVYFLLLSCYSTNN